MSDPQSQQPSETPRQFQNLEEFVIVLNALQKLTRPLSAPPTFVPQNFLQQVQFVDDGITKSLYLWINQEWVQLASGSGVAGNDEEVQFNDGGALAGDPNFKFQKSPSTLFIPNIEALSGDKLSLAADDFIQMAIGAGANRSFANFNINWPSPSELGYNLPFMSGNLCIVRMTNAAPGDTPAAAGLFHLDVTNKKLYVSVATSSSADWIILN